MLSSSTVVALTLLDINEDTEIAIVEMGASKKGDIRELCSFGNPTCGLITNVGKAHLEGFGSFQGVIETKTEMYDFLLNANADVFVNQTQSHLVNSAARFNKGYIAYQDEENLVSVPEQTTLLKVEYQGENIQTQLTGGYNVDNVATAIAIGEYFEVPFESIKKGLEAYEPSNNRSQIIKTKQGEIIMDAYNANPFSMKAALENLAKFEGQKIAVLGDMFELGEYAYEEHKAIAQLCQDLKIEAFLSGEEFLKHKPDFGSIKFSKDRLGVVNQLKNYPLTEGYNLLIKGSRGMALEKLVEELEF